MIVSYRWLKDLLDFDMEPAELAHRLTMAGLEVEGVTALGAGLESVIVARLDAVQPHPNADRLTVCQVNTGTEVVQVVCGATNHRQGDLVALAQPGTVLPGDFKIKKSKIRGEESAGMLCSTTELGLSETAEGILILDPAAPLGAPVIETLGLTDVIFEIGLTPNRPDALSHLGIAREIGALIGKKLCRPEVVLTESTTAADNLTSVAIEDADRCPRYAARLIRGVTVKPSPEWMVRRLEAVGQRSINNVVDVTNYVLMELGHPLHAFDFKRLRGGKIIVRTATEGERFVTLDEQERVLSASDLMICDSEGPVALAGIMGGQNSEVQADTVDILLESAYFEPRTIRRTAKRLGVHTEASHRFERGADIDMVPVALDRAAALIAELGGGQVDQGRIDVYPQSLPPRQILLRVPKVQELLGVAVDPTVMANLLQSIDLDVASDTGDSLSVSVPSFRPDLEREVDLIEEVARLYGYDNIPVTMPQGETLSQRATLRQRQISQLREVMVGLGWTEAVNYAFVGASQWDKLLLAADDPRRQTVDLLNPLADDQAVMRTTLIPSLLETLARNLGYQSQNLRLFELRPVFLPVAGDELPTERLRLTAVLTGRRYPEGWAQSADEADFFDVKGVVEAVLDQFRVGRVRWSSEVAEPYLHPGKAALFQAGRETLGVVGELHPRVQAHFDIERPVYLLDIDVEVLLAQAVTTPSFQPLSRFPGVSRDSAFLVDATVTAQEVMKVLKGVSLKDIEDIALFDVYTGQGIPAGKKSLAVRVRYRSMEKTLTDEAIESSQQRLLKALRDSLGAVLR